MGSLANITLGQMFEQHVFWLVGCLVIAMLGWTGWVGWRYRAMKKDIENLKNNQTAATTHIILESGSTYNDFKGANGEFHVHLSGKAEIISTKPLPLRIKGTFGGFTSRANLAPPKKEIEKVSDE